jgi:tetratricopeptide (TPR) repeat protein
MSSIIPGYEYDIFISYRQKDNKGDRWVSEFVEALKTELESTFKEEISVYFDINPHDGLLETHDVDASLKEKLKCLIFIPIISRTYCDPKSFAWEHEFKVFVQQASQDQFGLKVKLSNGNVSNRVLPIRIHDLDNADIKFCESILDGVLRGIEFIYKDAGFNRPLKPDDDEKINLNRTKYRNQITKVALALKEIIRGLQIDPFKLEKKCATPRELFEEVDKNGKQIDNKKPFKLNRIKLLSLFLITVIVIVAGILIYPKVFKLNKLADLRSTDGRVSVAIMPFQNMTNDTIWNVWQDGIQNELISNLTNSEELEVRQIESITDLLQSKGLTNYASITPAVARSISQKLDASVLIYGTIKQAGAALRVNAQLINSKTEEVFKSFEINGPSKEDMIFKIIDSLKQMVKNYLVISKLGKELSPEFQKFTTTNSAEAYRYYIYGQEAFMKYDYPTARNMLLHSISNDSNFYMATMMLSFAYGNPGMYDEAKKWCLKLYEKRDQMPVQLKIRVNATYAKFFETPYEIIKYWKQSLELDDQMPTLHYNIGGDYNSLFLYDKAIPEFEKALGIYKKWGIKPAWADCYTALGHAYHEAGQYKQEKKLYKRAEQDFPGDHYLNYRQAVLCLSEGDSAAAKMYIDRYISICKDKTWSEADIITGLAHIYSEADIHEKAEKYYRQALVSAESGSNNDWYLNNLARFLIDIDRNINEGINLVDKALELSPDRYNYLDTKGWGLYKQGKYQEALEILQKSWDLRMKNAIYDHQAFLHLESAKMAIVNQKNN